jgi:hypothetical protein
MNSEKLIIYHTFLPIRDKEIKELNKAHIEHLYNFSLYLHVYYRNNAGLKVGIYSGMEIRIK